MFAECTNLQTIDMSSATFNNVNNYTNMFLNIPSNVTLIVKDNNQKNWLWNNKTTLGFSGNENNIKLPTEV